MTLIGFQKTLYLLLVSVMVCGANNGTFVKPDSSELETSVYKKSIHNIGNHDRNYQILMFLQAQ